MIALRPTSAAEAIAGGLVFVRCNSHRARRKVSGGAKVQGFFSFRRETGKGGCVAVSADDLPRVLRIAGVTRLRAPFDDLSACWSF